MIRKRKGKSSKLARMSEEERVRYMRNRAELELETKRRKQQLIATFAKNKLKREEAFSRLNVAKINEKWRYILRQIKCKELYDNVKCLYETFDRVIKLRDKTIISLHNELEIADADHRKLQEFHILLIDKLIGKHKQNLQSVYDVYKLECIKSANLIQLNQLKDCMEKTIVNIWNCINKRNKKWQEGQHLVKTQNAINIHNLLYLEENAISNFTHQYFIKLENLWDQLKEVIKEYEIETESKRKQYEYVKVQDQLHQESTLQYSRVISQLKNDIESLKHNIKVLSFKREEKILKQKEQIENMKEKMKHVKHEFTVAQFDDSLQLKKLAVKSNDVLKVMQKTTKKGSVILEIIKICLSLEPLFFNVKKYFVQDEMPDENLECNMPKPCDKIDKFWKQYNHIKAGNILLKKESNTLCAENKILRQKLKTYLTMFSNMSK